jgi:hypothetical protein
VLEIDQAGAEVFLDGKKTSVAVAGAGVPVQLEIEKGLHQLKVVKPGFLDFTTEFATQIDKPERIQIKVVLQPLPTAKKEAAKDAAKDAPKDARKDSDKPAPPEYVKVGTVTGQVASIDETRRVIRLKVPALNPDEAQGLKQAQQEWAMARNVQQAQQAQQKIAQHQAKLYSNTQEVQITTVDDLTVRLANPPAEFDEKGQPKRHNKEELAKLKGDPKLPGYKGDFSDLQPGYIIQVTLVRYKDAKPAARPKAPMNGGNKDADPAPAVGSDDLPQTNFVVVVAEGRPGR